MYENLITFGVPALTFGLGYFVAAVRQSPNNSDYWEAIASRNEEARKAMEDQAERNWKRFTDACKEANTIEEELVDCQASNQRLTDALAAKTARLERIYEKGIHSKSGSAQHLARIASGDC